MLCDGICGMLKIWIAWKVLVKWKLIVCDCLGYIYFVALIVQDNVRKLLVGEELILKLLLEFLGKSVRQISKVTRLKENFRLKNVINFYLWKYCLIKC